MLCYVELILRQFMIENQIHNAMKKAYNFLSTVLFVNSKNDATSKSFAIRNYPKEEDVEVNQQIIVFSYLVIALQ